MEQTYIFNFSQNTPAGTSLPSMQAEVKMPIDQNYFKIKSIQLLNLSILDNTAGTYTPFERGSHLNYFLKSPDTTQYGFLYQHVLPATYSGLTSPSFTNLKVQADNFNPIDFTSIPIPVNTTFCIDVNCRLAAPTGVTGAVFQAVIIVSLEPLEM